MYQDICNVCDGDGVTDDDICPECNGTGTKMYEDDDEDND